MKVPLQLLVQLSIWPKSPLHVSVWQVLLSGTVYMTTLDNLHPKASCPEA